MKSSVLRLKKKCAAFAQWKARFPSHRRDRTEISSGLLTSLGNEDPGSDSVLFWRCNGTKLRLTRAHKFWNSFGALVSYETHEGMNVWQLSASTKWTQIYVVYIYVYTRRQGCTQDDARVGTRIFPLRKNIPIKYVQYYIVI